MSACAIMGRCGGPSVCRDCALDAARRAPCGRSGETEATLREHLTSARASVLYWRTRAGQSRRASFAEACVNVLVGYGVALLAQLLVFPLVGVEASMGDNLIIGACFTLVSLGRSYCIRRVAERFR